MFTVAAFKQIVNKAEIYRFIYLLKNMALRYLFIQCTVKAVLSFLVLAKHPFHTLSFDASIIPHFLHFARLFQWFHTVTAGSNANAIEGDLTSDGRVDSADLILMRHILLGTYETSADARTAADLNKNGTIDIVDLVIMKKLSAR